MINNWDQSFPADTIKSISTFKVDHNFNGISGKLSGYYSRYWGPHYNGSDGLPIPITAVRRFATSTHTMRVSYDWTTVADDAVEHSRRIPASLESRLRTARSAQLRSGRRASVSSAP